MEYHILAFTERKLKKLSTQITDLHRKPSKCAGSYYMSMTSKCIHLHYMSMHMFSRLHRIIVFTEKGRHLDLRSGVRMACARAVYRIRMNMLHVTFRPQVVYRAVYLDWKLQNNCEKHSYLGNEGILDKSVS